MFEYRGTTALITGASKGIGEALAWDLAGRGAHLALVARSVDALEDLSLRLRSRTNVTVEVIAADLSDIDAAAEVVEQLEAKNIDVDLLFNNAGMGAVGPFLTRPLGPTLQSVDLNITALVRLTHALGHQLLKRRRGGIINVASVAGFQPMPFQASYGATKAFVLSFTEALGEELRDSGVRVMAAHPGPVATGFFDNTTARIDPHAVTPERIARKILDDFARGRSTSFPGRPSDRATAFVSRLLPRATISRIVGNLNRKNGYDNVSDIPSPDSSSAHHPSSRPTEVEQ